jgi:SAM-dependent methyltransferase
MNPFVRGLVRAAAESFTLTGPILEVGSRLVTGQDALGSPRVCFPGRDYTGVDLQPGEGVDVVASVEDLPLAGQSFGTVLALETLEHVERFWVALDEMSRILRPDGVLILSTPFFVHIHNHPADYWRFTPEALNSLLRTYPQRLVGSYGPERRPTGCWAIAFGPERIPPAPQEVAIFRRRLGQYTHWPLNPIRWVRYVLGRLLFGRRPFEGYLLRNQFQFTWHQDEVADARQPLPSLWKQTA